LPCWPGHGGATGAPQGLCLEEPLVVRVVKLSLQVVGLSLRARSAGASGDRRGTDKNNRVLSRNVTKERVLSCGTLLRIEFEASIYSIGLLLAALAGRYMYLCSLASTRLTV